VRKAIKFNSFVVFQQLCHRDVHLASGVRGLHSLRWPILGPIGEVRRWLLVYLHQVCSSRADVIDNTILGGISFVCFELTGKSEPRDSNRY
jgi:hypothetical protein